MEYGSPMPKSMSYLAMAIALLTVAGRVDADELAPSVPPRMSIPPETAPDPALAPTLPTDPAPVLTPDPQAPPAPTPTLLAPVPVATPMPISLAPTTPTAAPDNVPRPSWKLCLGLGVGAAAALITGATLGGLAKARSNEQEGNVGMPPLYDADLASRAREGERMANAAYVLLAIGSSLAIADVVLWVERLRKTKKQTTAASTSHISAELGGVKVVF